MQNIFLMVIKQIQNTLFRASKPLMIKALDGSYCAIQMVEHFHMKLQK